jgi:hypothetical protein
MNKYHYIIIALIFLLGSEIGFAIGAYLGQNYLK